MIRCQAALLATKKHPNRMPLFQVVYGQSLILTRCVVSNSSNKTIVVFYLLICKCLLQKRRQKWKKHIQSDSISEQIVWVGA